MRRPVILAAIVYVAGLSAGHWLRLPTPVLLGVIGAIVISQGLRLARRRTVSEPLLWAAVFLLGAGQRHGIERDDAAARAALARLRLPAVVRVEGRVAAADRAYLERAAFRLRDCTIRSPAGDALAFPTEIQLVCSGAAFAAVQKRPPEPGDRVIVRGRLASPPDLRNPDVFNYGAYLERRGIGASLFVKQPDALAYDARAASWWPWTGALRAADRTRRRIERDIDAALDPRTAALVRSIFLGQAERLDDAVKRDFTRCGLAHIFSVSGLHVVMLLWVLATFVRFFGLKPAWRSGVLIVLLLGFCAIAGFRAPAVRALIMLAAILAQPLFGYRVEPLTTLAGAALLILAFAPRALWQADFQLSFVCMLSIVLLMPALEAWRPFRREERDPDAPREHPGIRSGLHSARRYFVSGLALTLAAQIGNIPLIVQYFHMVPLVGLLANVPAAILVWFLMAGTIAFLGAAAVLPILTYPLAGALAFFSDALIGLLHAWSHLPGVAIAMPPWPVAAAALYYALLFGWVILPFAPSPFHEAKQRARLLVGLAALGAWLVWAPLVGARADRDALRVTFLDVGQGDSCVIELPGGAVVLIDGGDAATRAGERVVAPFLEARGIERLDAVIATHPDADHTGGLAAVFEQMRVALLVEGARESEGQAYRELRAAAERTRTRREVVAAGDRLEIPGGARIGFLHPAPGRTHARANDDSLVLLVDCGEFELLLAGDIEGAAERETLAAGSLPACEVLKVAHHGSGMATTAAFLARVQPRLAVISCGRDNVHGHPSPEVLDRLARAGVEVARTDRDGAVTVWYRRGRLFWRKEGKANP